MEINTGIKNGCNIIRAQNEKFDIRIEIGPSGEVIVYGAPKVLAQFPFREGTDGLLSLNSTDPKGVINVKSEISRMEGEFKVSLYGDQDVIRKERCLILGQNNEEKRLLFLKIDKTYIVRSSFVVPVR